MKFRDILLFLILSGFLFSHTSCTLFTTPSVRKALEINRVNAPYDAVIVPGVPFYGDTLERVMQLRVAWATHLYKKGYTKNIIYSGGAVYTPYSEAKVMAIAGEAMGIDPAHIFIENRAEHSTENVYYSYLIAKEKGWTNIALATDPYQTKSLYQFIEKFDLPVKTMPTYFKIVRTIPHPSSNLDFESAKTDDPNFIPLPERETIFQRLNGTIGNRIVWEEDDVKSEKLKRKFRKQGRLIDTATEVVYK